MTHNYKGRQARRVPPSKGRHRKTFFANLWLWSLTGAFLGILGVTAAYLLLTGHWSIASLISSAHHSGPHPSKTVSKKIKAPAVNPIPKKAAAPRFEFYQVLPDREVPLPVDPTPLQKPAVRKSPPHATLQTKVAAANYLIQADAFKALELAERLKARLVKQGFSPRIQKVEAEDGVWFRVILGPFPSETIALKHKNTLARQKIHGILLFQR